MDVLPLTDRTLRAQDKARILQEALPWVTRWAGCTFVVKYGGNALDESEAGLAAAFAGDVALLRRLGVNVVVVHGGGPQISALASQLGMASRFVNGLRCTDAGMLEVVKMVLLGQVNPQLVRLIADAGVDVIGVSGTDAGLIAAAPLGPPWGYVGEVAMVDPRILINLLEDDAVPVVATLGRGPDGGEYNINADAVAGAIAAALGADKLIYLTNVPGLYEDFGTPERATLISTISMDGLRAKIDANELHEGMAPKAASILAALEAGVAQAFLLDGRVEHALLLEIFTNEGSGTMFVPVAADAESQEHPLDRSDDKDGR